MQLVSEDLPIIIQLKNQQYQNLELNQFTENFLRLNYQMIQTKDVWVKSLTISQTQQTVNMEEVNFKTRNEQYIYLKIKF